MSDNVTLSGAPVLQRIQSYEPYPITKISALALSILRAVAEKLPEVHARMCVPLLKMVECYLCLTRDTLDCDTRGRLRIGRVYYQMVGAIASERFLLATPINRYSYIRAWNALVEGVDAYGLSAVRLFHVPLSSHNSAEIQALVDRFESSKVSSNEVFYWRSSQLVGRKEKRTWMPLRTIALRFGRTFAQFIHDACESHFLSSGRGLIEVNVFLSFLLTLSGNFEAANFSRSEVMSLLWKRFKRHFVEEKLVEANYEDVCKQFSNFLAFALKYLDGKGPFGLATWNLTPLPGAEHDSLGPNTGLDENGRPVAQKLLVDIPLEVTDADALNIIFVDLQSRVNTISHWATESADAIWKRHLRRVTAARNGKGGACASTVKSSSDARFARLADRFEKTGYAPEQSPTFTRQLDDAAFQFGLPQTGSLLPHMALLVIAHPLLTPSFFDNCELYDKHGHLNGLIESANGPILQGHKPRRGPTLAQQEAHLTPATFKLVKQVIAITTPLRDYLKKIGDDNWRKLFLTCGQGFGYPKGVKSTGLTSDKHRVRELEEGFVNGGLVPQDEVKRFIKRFSLISLRATTAVLSYIENPDLAAFAKRLGHAKFDWLLMGRYMPTPLLAFFQERWVRLFQHAIIVTAMRGSEFELRASGFETMEQLHEFLKNHALALRPRSAANDLAFESTAAPAEATKKGGIESVVFGVTIENLTLLLSLSLAVEQATKPVNSIAAYWAEYSRRMMEYIESTDENSVDLHDLLARAKILASPDRVREVIYA